MKLQYIILLTVLVLTVNYKEVEGELAERCTQDRYVGRCRARVPMWYYNDDTGKCARFYYGGCGEDDTKNIFSTRIECNQACR